MVIADTKSVPLLYILYILCISLCYHLFSTGMFEGASAPSHANGRDHNQVSGHLVESGDDQKIEALAKKDRAQSVHKSVMSLKIT